MNITNEILSSAPALARGLQVLTLLEKQGNVTLDLLTRKTGFPKASLLRLLDTMVQMQVITKHPDKTYSAAVKIVPINAANGFNDSVAQAIKDVSEKTGQTAEWYIPAKQGLVLVQRCEPDISSIRVVARIGFTRPWSDELDAVLMIALAMGEKKNWKTGSYWIYNAAGEKHALSAEKICSVLDTSRKENVSFDCNYNLNGVKRMASAVVYDNKLIGIIALAGAYKPSAKSEFEQVKSLLIQQAQNLTSTYRRYHESSIS